MRWDANTIVKHTKYGIVYVVGRMGVGDEDDLDEVWIWISRRRGKWGDQGMGMGLGYSWGGGSVHGDAYYQCI